jgi:hypothetical protein
MAKQNRKPLRCLFGLHNWSTDCEVCSLCGTPSRRPHDWSKNCAQCSVCRKMRESSHHKWVACKCSLCSNVRNEAHDWARDCGLCSVCGLTRKGAHTWHSGRCSTCGKTAPPLRTGDVTAVVDRLLEIQRHGYLLILPNERSFECLCSRLNLSMNHRAVLRDGRFACPNCGRSAKIEDYLAESSPAPHKHLVQVGTEIYSLGGMDGMRRVAAEFQSRGGLISHLSIAWNRVGGWLD